MNYLLKMKKSVILLLVAICYVGAQVELEVQDLGQFSKVEDQCIQEFNLNATRISECLRQPYMPEWDDDLNTLMECSWKKEGLLDTQGGVKWDSVKNYVKNVYIDAVGKPEFADFFATDTVTYCQSVTGKSPGQVTVMLLNCIIRRLYS